MLSSGGHIPSSSIALGISHFLISINYLEDRKSLGVDAQVQIEHSLPLDSSQLMGEAIYPTLTLKNGFGLDS